MPLKTIYESDFYTIKIDQENNLLRAEWLRPVSKEEIITGGTKLYEALRDSGLTRAVANAQKLGQLDAATKEWLSNDFYALLSKSPLQKLARVLPGNLFSRITLEAVATRAEAQNTNKFLYKNFANETEAIHWLRE